MHFEQTCTLLQNIVDDIKNNDCISIRSCIPKSFNSKRAMLSVANSKYMYKTMQNQKYFLLSKTVQLKDT